MNPCLFRLPLRLQRCIISKQTEANKNADNDEDRWNLRHDCDIIILIINV